MISKETLDKLLAFRQERDWEQFHTPRNLAVSLALEAAELLEVFQWARDASEEASRALEQQAAIREELADIAIYLAYFANDFGIDMDAAVQQKLVLNEQRYPVDRARGISAKYDQT